MLKDCEGWCCEGYSGSICDDTARRLPTEAEVRSAIFEAGWVIVVISAGPASARVDAYRPRETCEGQSGQGETDSDSLVLLALLRVLEACRG